jgi:glutamate/tyrosine decarboxylase-like PLP-dependent enzyme
MKERMNRLRRLSQPLEPDLEVREQWAQKVNAYAQAHLESLATAPAFYSSADEGSGILSSPISEEPMNEDSVLAQLAEHVAKPGVRLGSPGFFGFIPISTLFPAALGDYLAAILNSYSGNFFASPGAVRMEHLLTRWMADFVGYPKNSAGDLTSGGSISNLSAIIAARERRALKARDYEKAVVYLSSQTHHSVTKALRIAGLAECIRREIPLDSAYRMRAELLEAAIHADRRLGFVPWLIVAAAGSTDTGAIDPLPEIAAVAREHQVWLHVDGAYGAMFALCPPGKKALAGMELSDSLTLDPHKGLFMPCGLGAVLVRNGQDLLNAYRYEAHYMQDRPALASLGETSPSELSPELTRPFRGLRLWLSLKLIGVQAFRSALEEKLLLAKYFYEEIRREPTVELGPPPQLSVVTFRYLPKQGDANDFNARLLRSLQQDGRIFMTSTSIDGQFWIRLAVLCPTTHREHIDLALELIRAQAAAL